ncbi:MAG: hypothetical protein M1813_006829 [Trichoglossum hirsutum]|nr:MAG: hypothetical protein M1813_006829 [Trichoglossum hirsutum]
MYSLKVGTTTARHTIAGRAVHLRVRPRTRNLEEGRQVLKELERFGPVEMFRSLKYEPDSNAPNIALAIYQHESSAQSLLKASPIEYTLDPPPTNDGRVYSSMAATWEEENPWITEGVEEMVDISVEKRGEGTRLPIEDQKEGMRLPTAEIPSAENPPPPEDNSRYIPPTADPPLSYRSPWGISPPTSQPPRSQTSPRQFTLTASLSRLNHAAYVSRQPCYGPYSPMADPVHSALGPGHHVERKKREWMQGAKAPELMKIWKMGRGAEGSEGGGEAEVKGEQEEPKRQLVRRLVKW